MAGLAVQRPKTVDKRNARATVRCSILRRGSRSLRMEVLANCFNWVDAAFRWDGWRALAAIATFAAVLVALRRDTLSEKRIAIKDAHLIGAIIDQATVAAKLASNYELARKDPSAAEEKLYVYDRFGGVDGFIETIKSIKLSDCPTIEVMTTCGVLCSVYVRIKKGYTELSLFKDKLDDMPAMSMAGEIITINQCIEDMKSEIRLVSGKYYDWAHQEGHRRKVAEKLNGTMRARAIKEIPRIVWAIVTNKAPKPTSENKLKAKV